MLSVSWNTSRWGPDATGLDFWRVPVFCLSLEESPAGLSKCYFGKWVCWSCFSQFSVWSWVTPGTGRLAQAPAAFLWSLIKKLVTPKLCGISEDPPLWVVSKWFVPLTSTLDYSTGAQQDMKDVWLWGPSNTVAMDLGRLTHLLQPYEVFPFMPKTSHCKFMYTLSPKSTPHEWYILGRWPTGPIFLWALLIPPCVFILILHRCYCRNHAIAVGTMLSLSCLEPRGAGFWEPLSTTL